MFSHCRRKPRPFSELGNGIKHRANMQAQGPPTERHGVQTRRLWAIELIMNALPIVQAIQSGTKTAMRWNEVEFCSQHEYVPPVICSIIAVYRSNQSDSEYSTHQPQCRLTFEVSRPGERDVYPMEHCYGTAAWPTICDDDFVSKIKKRKGLVSHRL